MKRRPVSFDIDQRVVEYQKPGGFRLCQRAVKLRRPEGLILTRGL